MTRTVRSVRQLGFRLLERPDPSMSVTWWITIIAFCARYWITSTNVKPAVLTHIFDIVDRFLAFSEDAAMTHRIVVLVHLSILLGISRRLSSPLAHPKSYITSCPHMRPSSWARPRRCCANRKVVSEKTKVNLLTILNVSTLVPDLSNPASPTFGRMYELLSHLFLALCSTYGARLALTGTSTFN